MNSTGKSQEPRISGRNFPAVLLLMELDLQCGLINRCADRLQEASEYWRSLPGDTEVGHERSVAPIDIVATCSVILSAVAAIHKILFIGKRHGKNRSRIRKRCAVLMDLLGTPELQNIVSIDVRNAWEHMDERLDELMESPLGCSVAPIHVAASLAADTIVLRRFDPVNFSIHYANYEIRLLPCIAESKVLSERINAAFVRLQREHIAIYS